MSGNPALLRPQHVGIRIKRGSLAEAYICLDLKFAPTACSGRQVPDHVQLDVEPVR
jgi:ribonuclease I